MIGYLKGRIVHRTDKALTILTAGGVGYEVGVPVPVIAALSNAADREAELFIHTIVREDAIKLYGFLTPDDRQTFEVLLTVTQMGPKSSLAILSYFEPPTLRGIVMSGDSRPLTQVPGIGKKTAERVLWELRDKLDLTGATKVAAAPDDKTARVHADALSGLLNLGYDEADAGQAVKEVLESKPDLDVSGALRAALKKLGKAR